MWKNLCIGLTWHDQVQCPYTLTQKMRHWKEAENGRFMKNKKEEDVFVQVSHGCEQLHKPMRCVK
jgi:hypothetical protein